MKKGRLQLLLWAVPACLIVLSGCTLDEPPQSNDSPALTLRYEQNLSLVTLQWDAVKVTGFKEYIILQSPNDIPDNPTPEVSPDVTVVKRIQDVDETSLSVSTILFTPQMCYKLYSAVDDRFLYSSTICVAQDISIMAGFNDRACHTTGIETFVMFDRINDHLSICDYNNEEITRTVDETILNFPSLELSTWNNNTNAFAYDQSPGLLRKYDYPSLMNTHSKNFSPILWSVNVYNQFVFIVQDASGGNSFQVLNRSNLNLIDSRAGNPSLQNIAVFPGDSLTVMTLGTGSSKKYTIDGNGKITREESIAATVSQPDLQNICAEGENVFIAGRQGSIITREGENAGQLETSVNSFIMLIRLSPDEKTAVYVQNINGLQQLVYADISQLPAITKYQQIDIPSLTVADLVVEEEIVYLIGASFQAQPQTHILKYPLTLQ